jgi:hypothetical protein
VDDEITRCLLTHACQTDHPLAERVQSVLGRSGLIIEVDPFPPGVGIAARIETLDIQVLLFLLSAKSWRSPWCRAELKAAQKRGIPVVTARVSGSVPTALKEHIVLNLGGDERVFDDRVMQLVEPLRVRADLYKLVVASGPYAFPEDSQRAAGKLAFGGHDAAVLAEFVQEIRKRICLGTDPTTQARLAEALGRAGTRAAAVAIEDLLQSLPSDVHPLVRRALLEGRDRIPWRNRRRAYDGRRQQRR